MNYLYISLLVLCSVLFYFARYILGGLCGLYRVVPVNEAHIRILRDKKDIFSNRTNKSAYWYVPFVTKLHKLPLCNLAIPVNDIKLNDKNMAKFMCDIMCFININDVALAVERLSLTTTEEELGFDFVRLSDDLRAIMESIGRTVVTKQSILDIYMDREMLDTAITREVELVFPKWGIALVDLELKDIKDAHDSTIIHDIERKIAAEIRRDAEIRVATTTREAEVAKAEAEEVYLKRQIERDRQVGIAEQDRNKKIAEAETEANVQKIEAQRKVDVGQSEIAKQVIEQTAQAQMIRLTTEAEGEANKIMKIGQSNADIVRITKEADAAGTEKIAEALKKFDQTAIGVKLLDIQKDVLIAKFTTLGAALQKADLRWIISGEGAQKFFGVNLDAAGGANLDQFMEEAGLGRLAKLLQADKQ